MGDLNLEVSKNYLNGLCNVNSLKSLIRGTTCFESRNNSWYIDLFPTNRKLCFQETCAIETSISYFNKMVATDIKTHYKSKKQKSFNTQNERHFDEQSINFELKNELLKIDTNNSDFKEFNFFFFFFFWSSW